MVILLVYVCLFFFDIDSWYDFIFCDFVVRLFFCFADVAGAPLFRGKKVPSSKPPSGGSSGGVGALAKAGGQVSG